MLVDIGSPDAWPEALRAEVDAIAGELTDSRLIESEFAADLWRLDPDGALEARLGAVLDGHQIACYHATRLLPHEVDAIIRHGMRVLSDELLRDKVRGAVRHHPDLIDDATAESMTTMGPLTWQGTRDGRVGRLWVVAPFAMFAEHGLSGFGGLLGSWGGEALGWLSNESPSVAEAAARLTAASTATIVAMAVDATTLRTRPLWPILVGLHLDLIGPGQEWAVTEDVPAGRVVDLLHPVDPRWPRELGDPAPRRGPVARVTDPTNEPP